VKDMLMRLITMSIVLFASSALAFAQEENPEKPVSVSIEVQGFSVFIVKADGSKVRYQPGMKLKSGESIVTGSNSFVTITLADGSEVIVGSKSSVSFKSENGKNNVHINSGVVLAKVNSSTTVSSGEADGKDLLTFSGSGAQVEVKYNPDTKKTSINTIKGAPTVTAANGTTISPNQGDKVDVFFFDRDNSSEISPNSENKSPLKITSNDQDYEIAPGTTAQVDEPGTVTGGHKIEEETPLIQEPVSQKPATQEPEAQEPEAQEPERPSDEPFEDAGDLQKIKPVSPTKPTNP
jgi:hypothetical protein